MTPPAPPAPPTPRSPGQVTVIGAYGAEPIGGAEAHDLVNRLIAENAPRLHVRKHFKSNRDMVIYVAGRLAAVHSQLQLATATRCAVCGSKDSSGLAVRWIYFVSDDRSGIFEIASLFMGHVPVPSSQPNKFHTYHPLCRVCAKEVRRRIFGAKVGRAIGLLMLVSGLLLAATAAVNFGSGPVRGFMGSTTAIWANLALGVVGGIVVWLAQKARTHPALRKMVPKPFCPIAAWFVPVAKEPE